MSLDYYIKPRNSTVERHYEFLKKLRKLAQETTNQYTLYYYLYSIGKATLYQLYKAYCELTGRRVSLSTVRKQLKMLKRKALVSESGNKYIALLEPEEAITVFDTKRSRAGKKGALKRALNLYRKPEQLQIPKNLSYYVSKVHEEVQKLLRRGDRTAALDLIAHTYLPLRKTDVLWLWKGNEFIYWDNKSKTFRCLYSPELAKLLKNLGYEEGLITWHVLATERTEKILRKLFGKGYLDWPWSRSIAYGLMLLGLLKGGNNYRIETLWRDDKIYLILRDYYTGTTINEYSINWNYEQLPLPLTREKPYYKGLALGVAHTNPKNDESYFSRWKG